MWQQKKRPETKFQAGVIGGSGNQKIGVDLSGQKTGLSLPAVLD